MTEPRWPRRRARLLLRLDGLRTALLAVPDRPEPLTGLAGRALGAARRARLRARGRGRRPRLLRRDARPRRLPEGDAHRRVGAAAASCSSTGCARAVLTSATLAVDGGFDYLKDAARHRAEADELLLPSPFDYEEQAVLYVPQRHARAARAGVRGPGGGRGGAPRSRSAAGRAFVLFTSYANMNAVAERHRRPHRLPDPDPGRGARRRRCSRPSARRRAPCCFATASFWQGVDVAGEQLSCVIIDKLPFASPGDPVVAARIERLAQPRAATRSPSTRCRWRC